MDHKSVAVVIFSEDKKKILLIKRRDVPVWVLPGGKVENDEDFIQSSVREVKEETNFDIKYVRLIGKYIPINKLTKFTFLVQGKIFDGTAQTSSETKQVKFFEISELPPMPPPYEDWINDALKEEKKVIIKKLDQITYLKLFKFLLLHPILVCRFLLARIGFPINT